MKIRHHSLTNPDIEWPPADSKSPSQGSGNESDYYSTSASESTQQTPSPTEAKKIKQLSNKAQTKTQKLLPVNGTSVSNMEVGVSAVYNRR